MRMISTLVLVTLSAVASVFGAETVKLTQGETSIAVEIGGKPFTTYYFKPTANEPFVRPFFFPVNAADGTTVTSDQVKTGGDHPHHRSFWVAHGSVNGVDHWMMKPESAKQKHIAFTKVEGDTIEQTLEWEGKPGEPSLLKETRTFRFHALADGTRAIDLTLVLTANGTDVVMGDTKESGLCSVRVPKSISSTAVLTNSEGKTGEKEIWGKPAKWCDLSGKIGEKNYGIAIFDHPTNPRHPSTWHARGYGLMTSNIFGQHDFDKTKPKGAGDFKIENGKSATFKYRVVFHAGNATEAGIADKYTEFAK